MNHICASTNIFIHRNGSYCSILISLIEARKNLAISMSGTLKFSQTGIANVENLTEAEVTGESACKKAVVLSMCPP